MRGVSEEDQIAMAIAASMQDQQQPDNPLENESNVEEASTNIGNNINSTENEIVENSDVSRSSLIGGNAQVAVENTSDIASSTASEYESTVQERCSNNNSNGNSQQIAAVASE